MTTIVKTLPKPDLRAMSYPMLLHNTKSGAIVLAFDEYRGVVLGGDGGCSGLTRPPVGFYYHGPHERGMDTDLLRWHDYSHWELCTSPVTITFNP